MGDSSDYTLRLIDKLTAPARKMLSSIKRLNSAADQAGQAVDKIGDASARAGMKAAAAAAGVSRFAKAAALASRVRGGIKAFGADLSASRDFLFGGKQEMIGPRTSKGFEAKALGRDLLEMNKSAGDAMDKWSEMSAVFLATPLGRIASGVGFIASKVWDLGVYLAETALSAGKLTLALGGIAAAYVTKEVIELAAFSERARKSFAALTGSTQLGNQAFERARVVAGQLGMGVEEVAQRMIELRAAQFSIEQSEALTKLSADLATVTGHADAAGRIINAISKIKATGRLQGDELMMLAEAGLSLDMVYTRLEKNLGKNRTSILKMQTAGKISADQAITAIQEAILEKTHEKQAGEAAGKFAVETLSGAWRALVAAPRNFLLKVGKQIDTTPLMNGLVTLSKMFSAGQTGQLRDFVQLMVQGLGRAMQVVPHFVSGFASGFGKITKALSGIGGGLDLEGWAQWGGEALASFFEKAIKLAREVGPLVSDALSSFVKGFNAQGFDEWIKGVDWAKLGADFNLIAKALGEIYAMALKLLPTAVGGASIAANAIAHPLDHGNIIAGPTEAEAARHVDMIRAITGEAARPEGIRPSLVEEGRGEGLIARTSRWALGQEAGEWVDPTGQTPGYEPTAQEKEYYAAREGQRAGAATKIENHTTVTIQGAGLEEVKKTVEGVLDKRDARTAQQMREAHP